MTKYPTKGRNSDSCSYLVLCIMKRLVLKFNSLLIECASYVERVLTFLCVVKDRFLNKNLLCIISFLM
jgi:hypothetical protein